MHIETHPLQSSLACYRYPICSYQAYCVNNRQRFGEEEIFRTARETKSFMVWMRIIILVNLFMAYSIINII